MFLISTRSEKQISSGLGIWFWGWMTLDCWQLWRQSGSAVVCRLPDNRPAASSPLALCGYLLIIVLGWIWLVYNSLVTFASGYGRVGRR